MSYIDLSRKPGETELNYVKRLGTMKEDGIIDKTWHELANVFNKNCRSDGEEWGESAYRKKYASIKAVQNEMINNTEDDLIELRRELEKEKVKLRDERNQYNKLIREEARKESYLELFVRSIEEAASNRPLEYDPASHKEIIRGATTLVVPLTDIHCGIEIHNRWNDYDIDILRQMLNAYLDRIHDIAIRHGAEDVIVLGSELCSGQIHNNLRLQNNQDLIDQFLIVTDYVCDFLMILSTMFNSVKFYVAPGNHGRMNAKKEDSLAHENIENFVVPFVRSKLQNYPNIHCYDNEIDPGIVVVNVDNQKIVFVHGDLDNMDNATKNMTKLLGYIPDIIVLGHRHFNAMTTSGNTKVIQSGSFVGTDEYALSRRLIGKAEQSPFVISKNYGLECIYNIKFD